MPRKSAKYRWGRWMLIAFFLTQLLDGVLTYLGLSRFGHEAEGNPYVAFLIFRLGLLPGIVTAKGFSSLLGWLVYRLPTRRIPKVWVLAGLVLLHVVAAITGWTWVLLFF